MQPGTPSSCAVSLHYRSLIGISAAFCFGIVNEACGQCQYLASSPQLRTKSHFWVHVYGFVWHLFRFVVHVSSSLSSGHWSEPRNLSGKSLCATKGFLSEHFHATWLFMNAIVMNKKFCKIKDHPVLVFPFLKLWISCRICLKRWQPSE